MALYVNEYDINNEKIVLDLIKLNIPYFKKFEFKQTNKNKTASFDNYGYLNNELKVKLEIKTLQINSNKYNVDVWKEPHNMFNFNKAKKFKESYDNNKDIEHFIAWYYPKENIIRILNINKYYEENKKFIIKQVKVYHKRAKKSVNSIDVIIPTKDLEEYSIYENYFYN
tara:strand:+ start:164 stop:670 length:507 start_codon:yes stop_codon:yes gene_type:complete